MPADDTTEEEEKVALMGLKVNLADQTVYPESFRMHNDTINMILGYQS